MPYIALGLIFGWLGLLVTATLLLHKKAGVPTFYTRKLLHIGISMVWIIGRLTVGGTWHMFIPNTLSLLAVAASFFGKPIEGIEATPGEGEGRNFGTLYFALSTMLLTACNFSELLYPCAGLAFCALTFGDGMAAICGKLAKRHNPVLCGNKTLVGLLACYGFTLLVALLFNLTLELGFSPLMLLAIAGTVSILELYTPFGLDNFTIPLCTTLLCCLLRLSAVPSAPLLVCAISPFLAIVALTKRVFTPVAAASAFFILAAFAWFGGYAWMLNIVVGYGFVLAAKWVRHTVQRRRKADPAPLPSTLPGEEEKRGKSMIQLAANLLFPFVLVTAHYFLAIPALAVGAFASFACAISDSMASDIGVLQAAKPFDICSFRRVEPGVSGGVSLLGSGMALLSAAVYALLCLCLASLSLAVATIVALSALAGVLLDSLLGSLVQGKYRCSVCGRQVEKKICCQNPTGLISGLDCINNNTVNLISNGGAALMGAVLALVLL